jgi:hypothetical protein
VFDRANTDSVIGDLTVPPITSDYVDKIIDYGIEKDWGQSGQ